jgi:hypothetical protein
MFNAFRRRLQLGGCSDHPPRFSPQLECLENRIVPAIISGTVYLDQNNNGLLDQGEKGLPGSNLKLVDSTGHTVATTTSDANGQYQFTQRDPSALVPGTEEVDATFLPSPTNTSTSTSVAQFNPILGTLTSIDVIAEGSLQSHVRMENLGPASQFEANLSGTLSFQTLGATPFDASPSTQLTANLPAIDPSTAGTQAPFTGSNSIDFGTTNLPGSFTEQTITDPTILQQYTGTGTVNVSENATASTCTDGAGNLLAMVTTTAQGKVRLIYHYTPSTVIGPGNYTIVQTQQPPGGYLPGLATGGNVTPIPGSNITHTIPVTVNTPTDVIPNNNFAELPPGSLSGNVYVDVNAVGHIQPGDPPVGGVTITLTGKDTFGNSVDMPTQTLSNGTYSFSGLLPGTYVLTETQPANYLPGTTTFGSLGGTVNGTVISAIPLNLGAQGTDYNFGELTPPPPIVPNDNPPPPTPAPTPTPMPEPGPTPPPFTLEPSKFFFFGGTLGSFGW